MKRLLAILLICFTTFTLSAQKGKTDQIIKTNGFTIKAKVISTKGDMVTYQLPGESYVVQIKKTEIQKIIFNNGEVLEFSQVENTDEVEDTSGRAIQEKDKMDEKPEKDKVEEAVIIEEKTTTKDDLDSIQWINIVVTEDSETVKGLKELGHITGFAEGSKINTSTGTLLGMAIVDLQKEAAMMNAHTVLINEIKHNRAYGDLPKTIIEATAYGE